MSTKPDKEQRFIELTDAYSALVWRICFAYAPEPDSANDLHQEVLINIWQGLDSFRGDSKISTWIYRTAINTCITWLRLNKKHSSDTTDRLDDMTNEPSEAPDNDSKDNAEMLRALIAQLNDIDKAIISMWLDGCQYDTIAAVTGLSQTNVGVRLHRIKQRLAQMYS